MKIWLLYSKNTLGLNWQHRKYWSRSNSLLLRLGHVYRIDQFKKLRRMHKNIVLILSLFKNICSTIYTVRVCEIWFFTSAGIPKSLFKVSMSALCRNPRMYVSSLGMLKISVCSSAGYTFKITKNTGIFVYVLQLQRQHTEIYKDLEL